MRGQVVACWLQLGTLNLLAGLITGTGSFQFPELPRNCTDGMGCLMTATVRPPPDEDDIRNRHEKLQRYTLEAAKTRILEKLGLSGTPVVTTDTASLVGGKAVQKATELIKNRYRYSDSNFKQIVLFSEEGECKSILIIHSS